jgi:uncharacterized phage protein gp47/JayE
MPLTDTTFYRQRADILSEMLAQAQLAISDLYIGVDGNLTIILTIEAGQLENAYLANQLLANDMFIHTASLGALQQYGIQYDLEIHMGNKASGSLQFQGEGGTYIPIGTEAGYDPGTGVDIVYFTTVADGTLPDPGDAVPPSVAVNVAAGNLNGTYEYMVSFTTTTGETLPSDSSATVNPVNQQVNLTNIPLGGPGTIGRRIYRDKNGAGTYRLVATISNNTATTYTDNATDAAAASGSLALIDDTAHQVVLLAEAMVPGVEGNVAIGTITELTDAPSELLGVTNPAAFTGGTDQEDTEDYRLRLLDRIQSPQTGSPNDVASWAEEIDGVESATVFPNDNVGTAAPGHVTVRISGPGGTIPPANVITDVQNALNAQGLAQIQYHVATFTAAPKAVTIVTTLATGYVLADVSAQVTAAVTNYINNLQVGETMRITGIIDAVFGTPGVLDLQVTVPTTNQTATATQKITPGTITVS